jgi:hypothetical protein
MRLLFCHTQTLFSAHFLCINEPLLAPSHANPSSSPMMPNRASIIKCSAMISGSCGFPRYFLLAVDLGPGPLSPYSILNPILHHWSPISNPNVPTHLRHLRELQLKHVTTVMEVSMSNSEPDIQSSTFPRFSIFQERFGYSKIQSI